MMDDSSLPKKAPSLFSLCVCVCASACVFTHTVRSTIYCQKRCHHVLNTPDWRPSKVCLSAVGIWSFHRLP